MKSFRSSADYAKSVIDRPPYRLCAGLPRHLGIDHLCERGARRLLHAADARAGAEMAGADALPGPRRSRMWRVVRTAGGAARAAGDLEGDRLTPSMTNCAASAARITPSSRVIIASSRLPSSRMTNAAPSSASSVRSRTAASAARRRAIPPSRRCAPSAASTEAIEPGPAIIGIAIGKTEMSSMLRGRRHLLGALPRAAGCVSRTPCRARSGTS